MYRYIRHPNYPRRDDDLLSSRSDGVALAAVRGAGLGVGRTVRGQHGTRGSRHVAVPRVAGVQEALVVAAVAGSVTPCRRFADGDDRIRRARSSRTRTLQPWPMMHFTPALRVT